MTSGKTTDRSFTSSIADVYEAQLVPAIFAPYAEDLAARLRGTRIAALSSPRILELAAGTGVVTRALANAFPAADILATDLNPAMLEVAAKRDAVDQRERGPRARPIVWRQADATRLPFADAEPVLVSAGGPLPRARRAGGDVVGAVRGDRSAEDRAGFDVVVCQFGAMFLPDKAKGFAEARRVLKRGGVFLFNVWDRIEDNEFADVVTSAVAGVFPSDPPRFLARTPHGYCDVDKVIADLVAAGFSRASIKVDTLSARSKAQDASVPAIGFCQGTPLRAEIELRGTDARTALDAATAAALGACTKRFGAGAVDGKMQAHVFVVERT